NIPIEHLKVIHPIMPMMIERANGRRLQRLYRTFMPLRLLLPICCDPQPSCGDDPYREEEVGPPFSLPDPDGCGRNNERPRSVEPQHAIALHETYPFCRSIASREAALPPAYRYGKISLHQSRQKSRPVARPGLIITLLR